MGASLRPLFDQTTDQPPAMPIFPTSVQATGMPNVPGPAAGLVANLGGMANAVQNYRDVAIGKLARIHAMIDAGQLPQSALADPSLKPLFHQAGLDHEAHLQLLPKNSDTVAQQKAAELASPQFSAVGSPGSRNVTGLPQESDLNVQGSLNKSTENPEVAQVISKAPTPVQAGNAIAAGDISSRADVTKAGTDLQDAKLEFQAAQDAEARYKATGGKQDNVFRNALQVAHNKLIPLYVEMMKQQIAASQSSAADKKGLNDFLLGIGPRADAALTSRHKDWEDTRQKYVESIQSQQVGEDSDQATKATELKQAMDEYDQKFPEPKLPDILDEMVDAQAKMLGITPSALTPARANRVGFTPDAGSAKPEEVKLLDQIESQLKYNKTFIILAPPGTTKPDPQNPGKRIPVAPGERIEGTAEMLLNSKDPWATPSLKAHVRRFIAKGDPNLVNDPNRNGAGGSGHTPLNPGGVGQGAQPSSRKNVPPPTVQ